MQAFASSINRQAAQMNERVYKVIKLLNDLSRIISSVPCSELWLLALRKSRGRLGVLAARHRKEFFQSPLQRLERWPLNLLLSPAFEHDLVESLRTAWRTGHPIAMLHLVQDFSICHSWKAKSTRN